MELLRYPVADEGAHHAVSVAGGLGLDGSADVGDGPARPNGVYGDVETLAGDAYQAPRGLVDPSDAEGGVGVAVDPVEIHGHVDVDDVAVGQGAVVGDPVADDLVDRRAHRLGVPPVVEGARVGPPGDALGVDQLVELVCGDARGHGRAGGGQDLCRHPTRLAHAGDHRFAPHQGIGPQRGRAGLGVVGTADGGGDDSGRAQPPGPQSQTLIAVAALELAALATPARVVAPKVRPARSRRAGG